MSRQRGGSISLNTSEVFHPLQTTPPTQSQLSQVNGPLASPQQNDPRRAAISAQQDPIAAFLRGKEVEPKQKITAADVTPDKLGLDQLVSNGLWNEVLKLCDRCFQLGFAPHELLQFKLAQLISFLRLRRNEFAATEFETLGDLQELTALLAIPDDAQSQQTPSAASIAATNVGTGAASNYFYEKYPHLYQEKKGSMVPFTLIFLQALFPHLQGFTVKALDNLYQLLEQIRQQIVTYSGDNDHSILRPKTPTFLSAYHKKANSTNNSSDVKKDTSQKSQQTSENDTGNKAALEVWKQRELMVYLTIINCHISKRELCIALQLLEKLTNVYPKNTSLLSLLGCLYLQMGILNRAEAIFNQVEILEPVPTQSNQVLMNKGYLLFANGQYSSAFEQFNSVVTKEPTNVIAANNRAICLLYTCNLSKAIESLEEVIRSNPEKTLDETLVFNLCTLYDLEAEKSIQKKRVIHALVTRFKGEDFPLGVLKLQS